MKEGLSMRVFLMLSLLMVTLFSPGCGAESETGVEAGGTSPEATREPPSLPEDKLAEKTPDHDNYDSSVPSLSLVEAIKIVTLAENPRDGFKAEVVSSENGPEDTNFLYDWKVNGNNILGESGEELGWRDEFKKGDTITVSVTPYSSLGQGVITAEGSFKIPNSPPVIISEPEASFEEARFTYTVVAEDPDGDPIDFTLRGAPAGMTIEPATGLISWEYGGEDSGDYTVTIIVSDSEGAQAVQKLTLTINPDEESALR